MLAVEVEIGIAAGSPTEEKTGWNGDVFTAVDELSDSAAVIVRIRRLG